MSFLADACALIVFLGYGAKGMSRRARSVMGEGDVFVSAITVWEITRKVALGKLSRTAPPGYTGTLAAWLRQTGYRFVPLSWEDGERANLLPPHHKDPMDRMLIAAALANDLTIISDDQSFAQYGVRTLW